MDVTPELIETALKARRETMARTSFRKVEWPGGSAMWQIVVNSEPEVPLPILDIPYEATLTVCDFTYERAARAEYDRIIMRGILDAVANHLVKGQALSPSQAD